MIKERIQKINQEMSISASSCGRDVQEITLIGVTKTKPIEMVKEAFGAGLCDFGENYVEEFSSKESEFHPQKLNYHFIGRLPTKKVTKVVGFSSLIHSVGSLKLAKKIDFVASEKNICQDVLVQINQGSESSKSGILASEAFLLVFWLHFIALNLFLGTWVSRDGLKYNLPRGFLILSLIIIYFTGPVGLVLYWFIRIFYAKKLGFND